MVMFDGMSNLSPEKYKEYYQLYTINAAKYWANKDRLDYKADLWAALDRNEISIRMLRGLCKGKKVLDMGAAHWVEEDLLSKLDCDYTKLDIAGSLGGENIVEADACDTPFPDKPFDVIICRELIEHVLDANALLKEIKRLLIDGGYLHITTPNSFNLPPDGINHIRGYTPRGFLISLQKAGFEVIDKRGSVPNLINALLPISAGGYQWALDEFREIAEIMSKCSHSYYLGTLLFVLARKQ